MDEVVTQVGEYAPLIMNAVKALVVLVLGWIVAGAVGGMVRRRINSTPHIDPTLGNFMASLVKWAILAMVLVAVLGIFGIQATSIVAILGAASLAIGLALQGTLSDLAAGVMLVVFRPYKLGQYVDIGGTAGTVKDLNLFTTELVTPDNVQIIVPNGQSWGSIITNYSAHDTRRVDLVFGIDYGDSADKAMQIILDVAKADSRIHSDPEPWVKVTNLGDSSVDLTARLWCDAADYWDAKFELTKAIKEAFDDKGISIPYPHAVEIQKQG
ncbi:MULTISPECIES: mechanosensitive ion channel domain-containing protein [unclassified Ruegeria]|uniref:mechanosensitive ion channel domain-containing protein n=1 Tax=unclassified Ruegeria TaxID=2625375 RepID=UPI001487B2F5|nr:mechanosensitive ion channel [Ruegeria sp. HKCCD7296]NOD48035.1 mechanosensitive ion channel [Ruegeria sp. HKCCD5849]NOD53019.1 mechanosensitive ion channel [Ruegeria sp. HKCCD5851]NOD69165.1 mechanosensitive ion channel [Ruegeria sp. HKCCD7303]NOE35129.1 mechanosensitive ion channel [Ruegeria sp. HKCCD7318]NOE42138.1 mechanosensitive ion channel [Ruegeria sp. HKCCD7319]